MLVDTEQPISSTGYASSIALLQGVSASGLDKDPQEQGGPYEPDWLALAGSQAQDDRMDSGNIKVVRFQVWQNVAADTYAGPAPLRASLLLELPGRLYADFHKHGIITLAAANGRQVVSRLVATYSFYGLDPLDPSMWQVHMGMAPVRTWGNLQGGASILATAHLFFGERKVDLELPETAATVLFTTIPTSS